jgi:prepilin peptidase CpaA
MLTAGLGAEIAGAPWQAQIALATLFVALSVSVVTDLRRQLILNSVTLPALCVVLGCSFCLGGAGLVFESLIGALICAGPLFIGLVLRAMGAGDVKLMAVCGAVSGAAAGWPFAATVALFVSIAGGIQAVLWLVASRLRGQKRPKHIPYGVAIAAGTAAAFVWNGPFL